jgi:cytochrome c-type biogenesis protein CcmE
MNKNIIIALLLIATGIAVFFNISKDVSTYATFQDAKSGQRVKIVGQLSKDKPMIYEPEHNPDVFSFYMVDSDNIEKQVILLQPKPQDFEMSEQIVVTGKMDNDIFTATDILMKCPSKYKDEEIALKESVN